MTPQQPSYDDHHIQAAARKSARGRGTVRTEMIEGAMRQLAVHGLEGTSFSTVLEATGAPRGSIYHHFPGGKDELVAAAVEFAGSIGITLINDVEVHSAADFARHFTELWRSILTRSGMKAGCTVLAVAVAAANEDLVLTSGQVFDAWLDAMRLKLQEAGLAPDRAAGYATVLLSGCEGAVGMARAQRSLDVFEIVAAGLIRRAEYLDNE